MIGAIIAILLFLLFIICLCFYLAPRKLACVCFVPGSHKLSICKGIVDSLLHANKHTAFWRTLNIRAIIFLGSGNSFPLPSDSKRAVSDAEFMLAYATHYMSGKHCQLDVSVNHASLLDNAIAALCRVQPKEPIILLGSHPNIKDIAIRLAKNHPLGSVAYILRPWTRKIIMVPSKSS
jgi:hypothetical protein